MTDHNKNSEEIMSMDIIDYDIIVEDNSYTCCIVINKENINIPIETKERIKINYRDNHLIIDYHDGHINFKNIGLQAYNKIMSCKKIFITWKNNENWIIKPITVNLI